jgi:hypothetical protein
MIDSIANWSDELLSMTAVEKVVPLKKWLEGTMW